MDKRFGFLWLLTALLSNGDLALGEPLAKCIPGHYGAEQSVLKRIPNNLRGGIFRTESKTELIFHIIPRPALVLKSCSLDGPQTWEAPGWRITDYYPESGTLLLIEGQSYSPTGVSLYNLKSGSLIALAGIPRFFEDQRHFASAKSSSGPLSDQPHLDVGSCQMNQGGCKIIYSSRAASPSPALASVAQPTMEIQSAELQWLGPNQLSFVQVKRPLKTQADSEQGNLNPYRFEVSVPATVDKSVCECSADACSCKSTHFDSAEKCTALDGEFASCADCRAACLDEGRSSCPWGEMSIDPSNEEGASPIEIRGFRFTTVQCSAAQIREASLKREALLQKESPAEAAERMTKLAERRKKLSDQEEKNAEFNLAIQKSAKKRWDSQPKWAVQESKLIKLTQGRVERRDSGSKLVIRVPGRKPLVLLSSQDSEEGTLEGAYLEAYFPATETILLKGDTEPCEACAGCTPVYKLLGLKDGGVVDLPMSTGLSGYNISADGQYLSFGIRDMTQTEIWSCAAPLTTCKKIGDYSGYVQWDGPSSFSLSGPNENNPEKACKCSPLSCECKDLKKK